MSARVLRLPALVALVASLAACGDDTGGGGGGGGGDATTSTSTGDTTTGSTGGSGGGGGDSTTGAGAGSSCEFPDDNPSAAAPTAVDQVTGTVLTTDGDPVGESEVQLCGRDICLLGETDAGGSFLVVNTEGDIDKPILKAGDGLDVALFGFDLPAAGEPLEAIVPVLVDSGAALAADASPEADGVTLTVGADGVVAFDPFKVGDDASKQTFRAAVVPLDQTDAVAPGEGLEMIVGLGPHETRFCPAASLSVPNEPALEPGTAVELLLYGLQVGEGFVPYGEWSPVATGTVSEDGSVITTDDGEGIPVLGPIGIRVAN